MEVDEWGGIDRVTQYRCRHGKRPRCMLCWDGANTGRRFLGCPIQVWIHVSKPLNCLSLSQVLGVSFEGKTVLPVISVFWWIVCYLSHRRGHPGVCLSSGLTMNGQQSSRKLHAHFGMSSTSTRRKQMKLKSISWAQLHLGTRSMRRRRPCYMRKTLCWLRRRTGSRSEMC